MNLCARIDRFLVKLPDVTSLQTLKEICCNY